MSVSVWFFVRTDVTVCGTEIVTAGGTDVVQTVSVHVSVLQTVWVEHVVSVDVFQAWTPTAEATILMKIPVNNSMAETIEAATAQNE
jgi:hypothetical protein